MAGRGPTQAAQHQRERDTRRRQAGTVSVTPDRTMRGPDLAEATGKADWNPQTLAWYDRWRNSPQASLFEDTDWGRLLLLAPLVEYYVTSTKPSAAAISEIRLNEERLGALYVDRLRAKIHISRDDNKADAEVNKHNAAASKTDALARLKGEK